MIRMRYFRSIIYNYFSHLHLFPMNNINVDNTIKYFLNKHHRLSNLFKKCIRNAMIGNDNITNVDVLKDIIYKKCTDQLLPFTIYQQLEFNNLIATKIITDFCKKDIEYILQNFNILIDKNIYCINGNAKKLYDKITNMHFIVVLAQIFSLFKFIKTNKLNTVKIFPLIVPKKGNFISEDLFNECMMYGADCIMTDTNISIDIDERKALCLFFDKFSKFYNFIINNSLQELMDFAQENPDFNIIVGRYLINKSHITTSYAYKYLIKSDFFYLCDIIANNSAPAKNNDFSIRNDTFSQDDLVIEI